MYFRISFGVLFIMCHRKKWNQYDRLREKKEFLDEFYKDAMRHWTDEEVKILTNQERKENGLHEKTEDNKIAKRCD